MYPLVRVALMWRLPEWVAPLQREPGDGVLVITSRKPQQQRRLTQMLIVGFTAIDHRQDSRGTRTTSNNEKRHKYYEDEDEHGSRYSFLIHGSNQCMGRLLSGVDDEYATGRAAISYSMKLSFAQLEEHRCNNSGWTCWAMRRYSAAASSRTSLEEMASRHGVGQQLGDVIDLTNMG
ncbi:unnamed protein product [Phytophthora fragariaefolia]|uniref:Unnamed protein product n=1 Tax=Phytophthora fragariaefolia TaxID=1490495 RepID=A0A9W6Y7W1_9STRA|nr:unnamed protein product [Phytophthora fragariaefolia]